eukprot:CAMPEP_0198302826 /NCGR_PEP_ID=MMETSP1449-20131203/56568_1 /TAXON_ID=420275 /ORGANISM="Attheya septentrionalis, Strain CCMP2084" /LENGTH=267 /DNA_ID=CAMNT_0044005297 /DNA_START=200 /DNA_END=1004 /DNA_ORIENTATION=+
MDGRDLGPAGAVRVRNDNRGNPTFAINIQDGKYDSMDDLDPTISWQTKTTKGEYDFEFGIDATAMPTTDLASMPRSLWAKASRQVNGWFVSTRADLDAYDLNQAELMVTGDNVERDVSFRIMGSASRHHMDVTRLQVKKGFVVESGAHVTIQPRYDVTAKDGDVVIGWDKDDTLVEVTASRDARTIRISQRLDDENIISPSVGSKGDLSIEWERRLGGDSAIRTKVTPGDSVDVSFQDEDWTAGINLPLDSGSVSGANVSIKRGLKF